MPEADESGSTDTARRISRLERKVRYLVTGLLLCAAALSYDLGIRRTFVTRHLFTREFNVPAPSEWGAVSVIGGLAPAVDGKSIAFWLAGGPFSGAYHQTRIELDGSGSQRVTMADIRGHTRLQLATAADGTPSITLFGSDGKPTWSAPSVASR